jgi:hypothetical protein
VPLRIAFDLDGVLADMEGELLRQSKILFGERVITQIQQQTPPETPALPAETPTDAAGTAASGPSDTPAPETPADSTQPAVKLQLTARQVSRLWRHIATIEDFWESLNEIEPGVIARLGTLAIDRRWEVIFLTKRPETAGSTSQVQSQRWLESKGFTLPSVFVVQGSRGRIAASLSLDFVIDDRPENCLDVVADSKARAILVWREDEKLMPAAARRLGIGTVKSVDECLDILTEVDASPRERPGVVDRVMRLLGLKNEPARV